MYTSMCPSKWLAVSDPVQENMFTRKYVQGQHANQD